MNKLSESLIPVICCKNKVTHNTADRKLADESAVVTESCVRT